MPQTPPMEIARAGKIAGQHLDADQRGHLRRMFNLAAQLPDDWSGMMARSTLQEDFGALRFQLAYMAYGLALTHVHRLPAAPGLFREPFRQLIEKLKSPDVWTYWHYVSTGNGVLNRALGPLPAEWNPVVRDNIMYSAYLQSTALLYHHLFDDNSFARPGALSLKLRPLFWGEGPKEFVYDEVTLSEHIYWQMAENGFLGVACEPNCIFQICNQPSIFGFRFQDMIYGGQRAEAVTQGYLQAWSEFGMLNPGGHFTMMVQQHERSAIPGQAPWADFWLAMLMHAWNPVFVEEIYPRLVDKWVLPGPGGSAWVDQAPSAFTEAGLPCSLDFGWAAACAAELGDDETLNRLLAFADQRLHRAWDRGGLFYRRHDIVHDADGLLSAMDPHTGNVLLGLARLNIRDGLKLLYEGAWTTDRKSHPAIEKVDGEVDFERADYDPVDRVLRWTVLPIEGRAVTAQFEIGRLPVDMERWALTIDGETVARSGDCSTSPVGVSYNSGRLLVAFTLERRTELSLSLS